MTQVLTVKARMYPTREQEELLQQSSKDYIDVINILVSEMVESEKTTKKTSKDISANLNSAVKNQAIKDAKSVFDKSKKLEKERQFKIKKMVKKLEKLNKVKKKNEPKIEKLFNALERLRKKNTVPVLKKPVIVWNNQNYSIKNNAISAPLMINGKSTRVIIKTELSTDRMQNLLSNKLGTLRITKKSNKWIAQISVTTPTSEAPGTKVMGVDLGLKVPAVAVTEDGKTKFFGNGRQNKYVKRKYKTLRKKLGKTKKINKIKKISDKEQRYMKDQDHKISRNIVDFAKQNNISVIKLEKLANIRSTARTSRKNAHNLHNWSFYRLALYH